MATSLPSYLLPLIRSAKIDSAVTTLAKMESYELFVQHVSDRQEPGRRNFWKKDHTVRLTEHEQKLVDALLESQVELPAKLSYGKYASEKLAELYFTNVLQLWSGVKNRTVTSQGMELLESGSPISFTAPKVDNVTLKPGTGMVLNSFKYPRIVNWNRKFKSHFSDKISLKYDVNVNAGDIINDMGHSHSWANYIEIIDVATWGFWFKRFRAFTITVLSLIVAAIVVACIAWGPFVLFGLFMAVMFSFILVMIGFMIWDLGLENDFPDFTYVKTTPLGRKLAAEALPWDRFKLGSGDSSAYSGVEKILG